MEYFFYEEDFCSDLGDLMCLLDIEEERLDEVEEDWQVKVEEASLQRVVALTKERIVDLVMEHIEQCEYERMPEEEGDTYEEIKKAVGESIDIEKLNSLMPSLYYPSGNYVTITKKDLVEWCK